MTQADASKVLDFNCTGKDLSNLKERIRSIVAGMRVERFIREAIGEYNIVPEQSVPLTIASTGDYGFALLFVVGPNYTTHHVICPSPYGNARA